MPDTEVLAQGGYLRSRSLVRIWSMVTGFVRRMHLYHSKNRLSTSTSNISSLTKDGLDVNSSISTVSGPRITSKMLGVSDSQKRVAAHRKYRSSSSQGQGVHGMSVSPSGLRPFTLTTGETKSRFFPRTRSRTFGLTTFIHFSGGSS